jgi:hypothetical protein
LGPEKPGNRVEEKTPTIRNVKTLLDDTETLPDHGKTRTRDDGDNVCEPT